MRRQAMTMKKWEEGLDGFLSFNNRAVLEHAGSISHEEAEKLAYKQFNNFDTKRRAMEAIAAEEEYLQELEVLGKEI